MFSVVFTVCFRMPALPRGHGHTWLRSVQLACPTLLDAVLAAHTAAVRVMSVLTAECFSWHPSKVLGILSPDLAFSTQATRPILAPGAEEKAVHDPEPR